MLKPAGMDPVLMRESPRSLMSETAMRAATMQAVQQASGVRTTRWASTREIQNVLVMRGEGGVVPKVLPLLPQLLDEGVLEQQARPNGLYWRRVL